MSEPHINGTAVRKFYLFIIYLFWYVHTHHLNTRGIGEGESPSWIRQIAKSDDSLDRSQYKECQPSLQREVGEKSETRLRVTTKVETSQRLKVESGD